MSTTDAATSGPAPDPDAVREGVLRLESALCDPTLDHLVELVVSRPGSDTYRVAAVDGSVEFRRSEAAGRYRYEVLSVTGRDPLADQSTDRFVGHEHEQQQRFPVRTENAYPHAFDSIAQFFDADHAPDLVANHTSHHHTDAHLGQHGSLGVVQARAPFIAAGAGVRAAGVVDRSTRIVDVAPTVAALLGLEPHRDGIGSTGDRRADALLRRQDGDPVAEVIDGTLADHVVVFLLDGCNANLLHDAIESGEAPNIAALVDRGTAYRHGAMASLPTATLANHTTAVTGAHPGHSGVLHNTWVDRTTGASPDLLSLDQIFWSMQHLDPRVETLHQAVHRCRPDAFTTATFEFCDTGADLSTFAMVRERGVEALSAGEIRHMDPGAAERSGAYRFMSGVDHVSATQTVEAWERQHGNPLPVLSWCSLAVTDEAGHESGPHGDLARAAVRDSDARVGDVLAAVDRAGALERTAVLVIADHGMEQNDPDNDGSWDDVLAATGTAYREVGGGLIYIG
jgi:phosphonoacetate hydrolase